MTLYLDTSVLVSLYITEERTPIVVAWASRTNTPKMAISSWSITEFSSALSVKVRTKQLSTAQQASALAAFRTAMEASFDVLDVSHDDFVRAAIFANQHASNLRAGDALHLALAYSAALKLVTFDARLAHAARGLGVAVEEL